MNVLFVGKKRKAAAFVRYPDGTIGSVRSENEVRHMESRPLLVEDQSRPESRKEVVNG